MVLSPPSGSRSDLSAHSGPAVIHLLQQDVSVADIPPTLADRLNPTHGGRRGQFPHFLIADSASAKLRVATVPKLAAPPNPKARGAVITGCLAPLLSAALQSPEERAASILGLGEEKAGAHLIATASPRPW